MADTLEQTDIGRAMLKGVETREGSVLSAEKTKPKLYLIDIENFVGQINRRNVGLAQALIDEMCPVESWDRIIVGTGDAIALNHFSCLWPQAECVFKPGFNGADLALLRMLNHVELSNFSEVIIASGDHIFAQPTKELLKGGKPVTIVSRETTISDQFYQTDARIITYNSRSIAWLCPGGF